MPYRWSESTEPITLRLEPHQSLTDTGLAWFIGPTALMFCFPLLAVLGTPILWILLGFALLAIIGVWAAIEANRNTLDVVEELRLWPDKAWLVHRPPGRPALEWEANPHWVQVRMSRVGGPVENYLTLRGGGREVEIGAFLSPDERKRLKGELEVEIARLRMPQS